MARRPRKGENVKFNFRHTLACVAVIASLFAVRLSAEGSVSPRVVLAADSGWKFLLGDPNGADSPSFVDGAWRTVDLPHDWSIEGRPEKDNPSGKGGGFFPAGVGWYRKTFHVPADWKGKRVSVEFDGVYRDATVYLNGHKLGFYPNGYTAFTFDLTPGLSFTRANVLAARVDNSAQPNSRWYSGSGIYRHVRVVVTNPTHVAQWGVFVATPEVSSTAAKVSVHTLVANESIQQDGVSIETTLFDKAGNKVGSAQSALSIAPRNEAQVTQEIVVRNPSLWSPDSPAMYSAVSQVRQRGNLIDEVVTPFGIRSLAWSADKGLLLNGTPIKLHGGSVHHDNGPLGAAAFDRAEERKVELLKTAGDNAVRTAHNPPSTAFLDACDRLGLLVLDEPFDVWEAHKAKFDFASDFDGWWKRDISAMVLRDRNHPSIVIWGIGNEIPELEIEKGPVIAKRLADQVRTLDSTRPLTLAFPGNTMAPNAQAVFSLLDITGYNYNILQNYATDHEKLPSRIMLTTESYPAKAFPLWEISQDNPYVLGDLTWTAMDYLGESAISTWSYRTPEQAKVEEQVIGAILNPAFVDKMFTGLVNGGALAPPTDTSKSDPNMTATIKALFPGYPWHATASGQLDLTGYRKPQSYYREILWNGGDRVYATVRLPIPEGKQIIALGWATYPTVPSWSWQGQEGKELQVEVYSGAEKVRLFLNGKLIGEKATGREQEFKALFAVPYAPGTLKVVGIRGGRDVAESVLTTAGVPIRLRLTPDRAVVQADGEDLSFVAVEAVDAQGNVELHADQEVQFSLNGPGVIAAVGNSDGQDSAEYQGDRRKLFQGRALVIVRTSRQSGPITVTAKTPGLIDASSTIQSMAIAKRPELR
jgi:beta-galactosidase